MTEASSLARRPGRRSSPAPAPASAGPRRSPSPTRCAGRAQRPARRRRRGRRGDPGARRRARRRGGRRGGAVHRRRDARRRRRRLRLASTSWSTTPGSPATGCSSTSATRSGTSCSGCTCAATSCSRATPRRTGAHEGQGDRRARSTAASSTPPPRRSWAARPARPTTPRPRPASWRSRCRRPAAWAGSGVRANAICPRARTAMTAEVFGEDTSGQGDRPLLARARRPAGRLPRLAGRRRGSPASSSSCTAAWSPCSPRPWSSSASTPRARPGTSATSTASSGLLRRPRPGRRLRCRLRHAAHRLNQTSRGTPWVV